MYIMQITDTLFYTGILNPNLRIFDIIMKTEYGTTYNSYVIKSEKTVLVETAHYNFFEEYYKKITEYTPIEKIDYIILNHTEPDHTGSLEKLLKINPSIKIIATAAGIKNLKAITNMNFESIVVKDGDSLDIGEGRYLKFIISPNLHWPDSMFTWYPAEKILFSSDFLGAHYCEPQILDKYINYPDEYKSSFNEYYDAIFGPFKDFVLRGLDNIKDLDIKMIATSHGPILQERIKENIELYRKWSTVTADPKKASIFYVSAYGYTQLLANTAFECLKERGFDVGIYDIIKYDINFLLSEMGKSNIILFGTPTINRNALKPVWDMVTSIDAVNVKGKSCMVFGSYGWSGEGVPMITNRLEDLKLKVVNKGYKVVFKPTDYDLKEFKEIIINDFHLDTKFELIIS